MKALAAHFEGSISAVRSLLGQETERGVHQLMSHYVPGLEHTGEIARQRAIALEISKINTDPVAMVTKILEIRRAAPKRKERVTIPAANQGAQVANVATSRDEGHEH